MTTSKKHVNKIKIKNVYLHNLKNISLTVDHNQLIVLTGVSGSGKSSLAFDTIYAEGQRRYIESLSVYAKKFFGSLPKPEVDEITGLSPTIAIEQKHTSKNPRSTVGTMTGIYDFLRVLYAKLATPYCPESLEPLKPQTVQQIAHNVQAHPKGTKIAILAPIIDGKKGEFKDLFIDLVKKGYLRAFVDNHFVDLRTDISLDGSKKHSIDLVIDRVIVEDDLYPRLLESIERALELGKGMLHIYHIDDNKIDLVSQQAYCKQSNQSYPPLQSADFSFNHPKGMCEECEGLGTTLTFDEDKIIDANKSIAEDCCEVGGSYHTVKWGNIYDNLARIYKFDIHTPWKDLPKKAKEVFLYGTEKKWTRMQFVHPVKKTRWTDYVRWQGAIFEAKKRYQQSSSSHYQDWIKTKMTETTCPKCKGGRLKPYPAHAKFRKHTIREICDLPIDKLLEFFKSVSLNPIEQKIGGALIKEILERLSFLNHVGLHYLTLARSSPTLSGGESQRVRLAAQIGIGLVGTIYVLDEPSIGLHHRDHMRLMRSIMHLKDMGNTVIVVEHDRATIEAADHIIDIGPKAGIFGGEVVAQGSLKDVLQAPRSLTGAYLSHKKTISRKTSIRKPKNWIGIEGASHHNLKDVNVKVPLGVFCSVTGVSGSGKSSLITDILYPSISNSFHRSKLSVGKHKKLTGLDSIDKIIAIDQTPIGRTPRSNPATYINVFDDIRDLFANLPESKAYGYKPGRFSFNVKEGSCPHCQGLGSIKIDMDFLEDDWVQCPQCLGKRFDSKTLEITFKDKSIYDVLEMSVIQAHQFFENIPTIQKKLQLLINVGLDYLTLGQPSTTVSGGEAQRIKLAKELVRPDTGKTLYVFDEPTTGLHFYDIDKLITILHKLVDLGNTVIVIEHNLDLIKTADYIIDLGPEGGDGGGKVVGLGTPNALSKKLTPTGKALLQALNEKPAKPIDRSYKQEEQISDICAENASQNNLKSIDITIPRNQISVFTGPSGSGKSSLAFDTIYAEGQRRFTESLSPYMKQFITQMPKPYVEKVSGLSPAIAIEQKKHAGNPRSTVGTMTEVYDYLRIFYTRVGKPFCPETMEPIISIGPEYVVDKILNLPQGEKIQILSEITIKTGDSFDKLIKRLQKVGYMRIRLNGEYYGLEEEISYDEGRKNSLFLVVDRLVIKPNIKRRLLEAVEHATRRSDGLVTIALKDRDIHYNLAFAVESTGKSYPSIKPHTFSFNSEDGMCPHCLGLGFIWGANFSDLEGIDAFNALDLLSFFVAEHGGRTAVKLLLKALKLKNIDGADLIEDLKDEEKQLLFKGSHETIDYKDENLQLSFRGIDETLAIQAKSAASQIKAVLIPLMHERVCPTCSGERLNALARHVTIEEISLPKLCSMSIDKALLFIKNINVSSKTLMDLKEQITKRLTFLEKIGVGYLSLSRSAPTLSGGEAQRIHLSRQLGSGLTGCLYVLDEPTIGLHPHNNHKLNEALLDLKKLNNTLILVEHDPMTIAISDRMYDFGPKAGKEGGKLLAEGTYKQLLKDKKSITGKYLNQKQKLEPLQAKNKGFLQIKGAKLNNLKNLNLTIPYGEMSVITGVSGSGKSTLVFDVIKPGFLKSLRSKQPLNKVDLGYATLDHLSSIKKLIVIDQNPVGQTSRSDVSTYIDLLTPLRTFFSELPEAKMRGLMPKHFSYNHPKGMCKTCMGLGYKTVYLQFLPPVKIDCEQCHGRRLAPLSLNVTYKGKTLGDILKLTIDEAKDFLPPIRKVVKLIELMQEIGLGYVTLGQEIASLSGGEAQRLRLAKELIKAKSSDTLYLFDEPTTGLHMVDIEKLLTVFSKLIKKGNTLIVVEHNLHVIAKANYLIDLGLEGGDKGGNLIYEGPVKGLLNQKNSLTKIYLKESLT